MTESLITLRHLRFGYRRGGFLGRGGAPAPLFDDLSLDVRRGGIYGLLGRNGAGKSTLLKLVTGCLRPDAGAVEVFGRAAFLRDPAVLRRLYFLPEQVYLPAPSWRVLAQAYGAFYPRFSEEAFRQNLDAFEVPTDRKLTRLSLGQKKKGMIAFALACGTELLIMDEPTNGLDIPSKAQFRSVLAEAATEERAMVVSTHQVRDLAGIIDPVLIVEAGRVIAELDLATVSEVLSFDLESSLRPPADALHAQRVPGGHYVVRVNVDGRHTEPDLEVLFNAVTKPGSQVLEALRGAHPQVTH